MDADLRVDFDKWKVGIDSGVAQKIEGILDRCPQDKINSMKLLFRAAVSRNLGIDRVIDIMRTQGLDVSGLPSSVPTATPPIMVPVQQAVANNATQNAPAPAVTSSKPAGPNPMDMLRRFIPKVNRQAQARSQAAPASGTNRLSSVLNKKNWLIGGVVLGILLLMGGGAFFFSPSSSSDDLVYVGENLAPSPVIVKPQELINPTPLDWGSAGWFSPLILLIAFQIVGVTFALWGDANQRDQRIDFWVPVLVVPFTIFLGAGLPDNTPWWVPAIFLAFELLLVLVVTIAGGLDFTPLGSYFLLVGTIGGFVFGRIEGVQALLHIPSAPVLPINQLYILFQRMDWEKIQFPVLVYVLILCGVVLMLMEGLRPSEDKNPKWGTFLSAGVGVLVYAIGFYGPKMEPWVCYVVAYSLALVVASVAQKERIAQMTTVKWGIRSTFDGATLFTSVLLIFNIATGVAG